jgi:Photosynthetic reaction centre cytochrome C subunit
MKKGFLVILPCLCIVLLFQAFTTGYEPKYKNLKILPKDISEADLDSVMHHFTASLNVKCNYCHVRNEAQKKMDFASDDKPEKLVARKMMLMSIDINTKYFKDIEEEISQEKDHPMERNNKVQIDGDSVKNMLSYVTCFTCHRGDPHPETKPPHKDEGPRPPAPPVAPVKP